MATHSGSIRLRRMQNQLGAPVNRSGIRRRPFMKSEDGNGGGNGTAGNSPHTYSPEPGLSATPREKALSLLKGEELKAMLEKKWATQDEVNNAVDWESHGGWSLTEDVFDMGYFKLQKLCGKGEITDEQYKAIRHAQLYKMALGTPIGPKNWLRKILGASVLVTIGDLILKTGGKFGADKQGIATSVIEGGQEVGQDAHALATSDFASSAVGALVSVYILTKYGVRAWAGMQGTGESKTDAAVHMAYGGSLAGVAFGFFRSWPALFTEFLPERAAALEAMHNPGFWENVRTTIDVASQNAPIFTWSALAMCGIVVADRLLRPAANEIRKVVF